MTASTTGRRIPFVLVLAFWVLVWVGLARLIDRELYLPGPVAVVTTLWGLLPQQAFWAAVASTMARVLLGLTVSVVAGVGTALVCVRSRVAYELFHPFVTTVRATPVISFIVIALVWLRSELVPVLVCVATCFPLIWTSTVAGMGARDPLLLEMAGTFRVPGVRVARWVSWPAVRPHLASAIVGALGLGWRVTVAAEVFAHPPASIGEGIDTAKAYLDSATLFAWTLVVVLLSYGFEVLLGRLTGTRTGSA